jgi:hypothetical protein
MLHESDWFAVILGLLFTGGGGYMATLTRRSAKRTGLCLMLAGVVGVVVWFAYPRILSAQQPEKPTCSASVGGNNSGPLTNNCGNTYNLEDHSIKRRIRDLFSSIDPNINRTIDVGQQDL